MLELSMTKWLHSVSALTRMHFAIYDDSRQLIAASSTQDPLLSVLISNAKMQALYQDFIDRQLKLALIRRELFTVQSLSGQHHAFIPLHLDGRSMTIAAEAFFSSVSDFKRFYCSDIGKSFGVATRSEEDWLKDVRIYPLEDITPVLEHIGSLLETLIASESTNMRLNKYSQQSNTIISIMSDINSDYSVRNIYQIVVDTVIFLFEIDSAAIFTRKDGIYYPEVFEGRLKHLIQDIQLSEDNSLITQAASDTAGSTLNNHELLHAGFPEDITLVTLFHFNSDSGLLGILAVFNTSLDKEERESITNLCKLTAYLCEVSRKQEELENASGRLNVLSIQATSLYSLLQDRDRLYTGIVSEASNLAGAEKCSLMMSQDNEMLEVRASRGINRWLMDNVRVRKGEGIAGTVYEQGQPVLVDTEDQIRCFGNVPRAHYKTSSSLSLPLKVADEIIGVLNLSDKSSGASFAQSDISLLSPFILQASALLKLGVCYDDVKELKKLSITDSLTSLFNRRYFDIRLEEEYLRSRRYNLVLSLAILDIDDFKPFNDSEGHIAGDSILRGCVHYELCGKVARYTRKVRRR